MKKLKQLFFFSILLILNPLLRILARFLSFCLNKNGYFVSGKIRGKLYQIIFGGKNLVIGEDIRFTSINNIKIGNSVRLFDNSYYVCGKESEISIGNHSHIGSFSLISAIEKVTIGNHCAISSGVKMYTNTNDYKLSGQYFTEQIFTAPIEIGNNVLIGANVVILPGAKIEDNCILGSGAIIKGNVPTNSIFTGVPGKFLKSVK